MDSLWDSVKLFALQTGKNLVLGLLVRAWSMGAV